MIQFEAKAVFHKLTELIFAHDILSYHAEVIHINIVYWLLLKNEITQIIYIFTGIGVPRFKKTGRAILWFVLVSHLFC